jgi:predicted TIM-barrel fold metal-dependent hydrolase
MFEMTRQIIAAYTPQRCIWGSDFPTSLWIPKVTYGQHLENLQKHLGLSESENQAITGDTAMKLWFS